MIEPVLENGFGLLVAAVHGSWIILSVPPCRPVQWLEYLG